MCMPLFFTILSRSHAVLLPSLPLFRYVAATRLGDGAQPSEAAERVDRVLEVSEGCRVQGFAAGFGWLGFSKAVKREDRVLEVGVV